ncbi:ectonucleoside triphosphate diphosphohydrolase 1-like [Oscarella lobularis]|uniref:ectonucleoside triphosphate diphosphohydrolase 1-like n=1 Tax=Oscarella lobularis TaxID=121494 RepID=UPI00331346B0
MRVIVQAQRGRNFRNVTLDVDASSTIDEVLDQYMEETGGWKQMGDDTPSLHSATGAELDPLETLTDLRIKEGATILLKVRPSQASISRRSWRCIAFTISLIVACCLGVAGVVLAQTFIRLKGDPYTYGVVLDAGSSHTDVYVYRWMGEKDKGTGAVTQYGDVCSAKGGGISKFVQNPSGAGPSLASCLDTVTSMIPSAKYTTTRIYLGATAGMRKLNSTDPETANKIMDSVRETMAKSPFLFNSSQARIISPEVEGVSGWITVNYLLKNLDNDKLLSSGDLRGALDMGGASEQITFVSEKPTQGGYSIQLYGVSHQLYTHSYMCYGMNEAERQYLALLVGNKTSNVIENPCGFVGYNATKTFSGVYSPPCTRALPGSTFSKETTFTFVGTGKPAECSKTITRLFNSTCPYNGQCGFNGVYQPPLPAGKMFNAFSGYSYPVQFLNLPTNEAIALNDLSKSANNLCQKSWKEVSQIPSADFTEEQKARMCLSSQYVLANLLALHFPPASKTIQFSPEIDDTDLGWALGFMINATNMIPAEKPLKMKPMANWVYIVALASISFSFFLLTVPLIIWGVRRKHRKSQKYLALQESHF